MVPVRTARWPGRIPWLMRGGKQTKSEQALLLAAAALQYALLAGLVYVFRLESTGFFRLVALGGAGFIVHHVLPTQWRLSFFAALSLLGIAVVVTPLNAVWLIGCGLVLIALCHLPVRFGLRVALLLLAGCALAALRTAPVTGPWPQALWPLLGSMFMFRLAVYLYDLRNKSAPFSLSRAVAYFFMLPNVSFPLFPVVDYQTFCRSHYNDDAFRIYQKGASWFLRGIVHLLAHRWVYQNLAVDPAGITDASGVARYMLGAFLLYLKVSGTFHLIVGMLHFFGFNLPETHHRYLLATRFTDFWRRINIYWKDFIQKIVFYPVYFRLKRRGQAEALVAATAVAFLATWLLHSYQTFWIVGLFPLRGVDFAFWSVLGCGVLVNVLREAGLRRPRDAESTRPTIRDALGRALRTVGMFVLIVSLWSLWNADSLDQWWAVVLNLRDLTPGSAAAIAGFLAAIGAVAVWDSVRGRGEASRLTTPAQRPSLLRSAAATAVPSAVLLALGLNPGWFDFEPALADSIRQLSAPNLNKRDAAVMRRGYYEALTQNVRFHPEMWELHRQKPADWVDITNSDLIRGTNDFAALEFVPSAAGIYNGAGLSTNRSGMRDREYQQQKPPHTYRVALLGASRTVGSGVEDSQTFEALVEERLNRDLGPDGGQRYEVLNFAMLSYGPLWKLRRLDTKVSSFEPDALWYVTHWGEIDFAVFDLRRAVMSGSRLPYDHLVELVDAAQISADMPEESMRSRLGAHGQDLLRWSFERVIERCREWGIPAYLLVVPDLGAPVDSRHEIRTVMELGRRAGFTVIDLHAAYRGGPVETALWLAPWDNHPNARAHRLIADELYLRMRPYVPGAGRSRGGNTGQ